MTGPQPRCDETRLILQMVFATLGERDWTIKTNGVATGRAGRIVGDGE